ncbi:hypothetical protein CEE39_08905 [bacterium (candidate division B38) B3_B38]|nr:MAG: hypothetical protein CEE39_08905 [bacterium (candidate division B38) B3_B38]
MGLLKNYLNRPNIHSSICISLIPQLNYDLSARASTDKKPFWITSLNFLHPFLSDGKKKMDLNSSVFAWSS